MNNDGTPAAGQRREPTGFELRVRGHLESRWTAWFEPMKITARPDGTTTLTGPVADQAALHGLLNRIRDAGLSLLSVNPSQPLDAEPAKLAEESESDVPEGH